MTRKKLFYKFGIFLLILFNATFSSMVSSYTFTDLGTLGGSESVGFGINNFGHVAGYSTLTGDIAQHAFLYDGNTLHDLGTPGTTDSIGWDINDNGQVTGYGYDPGTIFAHAFIYDGSSMIDLGTLGGDSSIGQGINNSGQVTGYSHIAGNSNRAFLYEDGVMQDLGTLGGDYSIGLGISTNGQVTGYSKITGNSGVHAFIYDGSSMQDIGTLAGDSIGRGINASGHIVGFSYIDISNNIWHAFYYDGTSMQDIGTLGGDFSYAFGINNSAQVVGYSFSIGNSSIDAFLFDGSEMKNLCTITDCTSHGWDSLTAAYEINDNGDMTGVGLISGEYHAFLICNGATTSDGCAAPDSDNDGIPDDVDNCPMDINTDQTDSDYDGSGDVCDDFFNTDTTIDQVDILVDDVIGNISIIDPPGGSGLITKLTGNGGVLTIVNNAVYDYENDLIELPAYLAELQSALNKLNSFDKQASAKINNGQIIDPEATQILDVSTDIRQLINNLIVNAV